MADKQTMVVVAGSDAPENIYKAFIMATVGGGMDKEVIMFFTMSGLNAVKKGGAEKINMAGAPPLTELLSQAKELGVHLTACSLAMKVMGVSEDDLVDGVKPVGAATALDHAFKSDLVLTF